MKLNSIKNYNVFTDFFILHQSKMILTSLYGTEQVIKSMLANIDLNNLKNIELNDVDINMMIKSASNLKAMKKRLINDVYSDMYHYMIYDKDINYVEGNVSTYVISKKENHTQAVWNKVKEMSATPLLEHWQDKIISFLEAEDKISKCDVYGKADIYCSYIELESLTFLNDFVSDSVKNRKLEVKEIYYTH